MKIRDKDTDLVAKDSELLSLWAKVSELLKESASAFVKGFLNCREQIKDAYPDLDLNPFVPQLEHKKVAVAAKEVETAGAEEASIPKVAATEELSASMEATSGGVGGGSETVCGGSETVL